MMKKFAKLTAASLVSVTVLMTLGCGAGKDRTNVELIQDMMDQRNLKSQDFDEHFNRAAVRVPPANTVPIGYQPYKYEYDPLAAEANLKNPLEATSDVLARGKVVYNIYCSVCHGQQGGGDGTISQYIQAIPPLTSDKVKNFKDGRIFHIMTAGQGRMLGYSTQITKQSDRWAVVQYIRGLQKGN